MREELRFVADESPGRVARIQGDLLRAHFARLRDRSTYYAEALSGIDPESIRNVEDILGLPFTTNADLESRNVDFLAVSRERVIDHVTTSGTTGRPVAVMLSEADLERLTANEANSLRMAGVTARDVVQLMTTIDRRFMAGLAYYLGARALGAGVVRVGPGAASLQWDSILRFGTTTLITVPSFLVRLLEHARQQGIDPASTSVRKAVCIGEPIHDAEGRWNSLAQRIKADWDIDLLGTYASTEMATACTERWEGSGHAVQPRLALFEVLDEKDRPVPDGGTGEVVVTPFHVEAMPLLRYRTGDICAWRSKPFSGEGQGMWLGPVLGRKQQRMKVKGTTLYPAQVIDGMASLSTIPNFVVICTSDELGHDDLEILASVEDDEVEHLRNELRDRLRVAPRITPVAHAAIEAMKWPKDSRKPQLFIDRRTKHIG
ncbi:MAG: AMP-binding protein [Flavobacteriales bacterium]|nr:AMP-binding protein [Flavobacteriales bacterium]MCB9167618.1 AMP-binding protein [Flavobacteriales bacterium]